MQLSPAQLRALIVGVDQTVPLRNGQQIPYVNLDNAASTPPMVPVVEAVTRFLPWYASVHRGHGYKSKVSTEVFEESRRGIGLFFGCDPRIHSVILGKNATEALNKAAYRLPVPSGRSVLVSGMEHHSNDLPWRFQAPVRFCHLTADGRLDLDSIRRELRSGKISLVAVCGASNVTGVINPLRDLATLAHCHGASLLVDAAQIAPHYPVTLGSPANDWNGPDLIAISGHKLYAPFGTGALLGPKDAFRQGVPELTGGGTVVSVSSKEIVFAEPPDREEAGTPNIIGALALAKSLECLSSLGMERLFEAEEHLTQYAYESLRHIPGCHVYGPPPDQVRRVGVISFNLEDLPHGLVAAVLSHEYGIGVRHGCFCARPYVHHLLGLTQRDFEKIRESIRECRWDRLPGMVRISFGFYNTQAEVDYLLNAVRSIVNDISRCLREYQPILPKGEYQLV